MAEIICRVPGWVTAGGMGRLVYSLLAAGKTHAQISRTLGITERAVRYHVARLASAGALDGAPYKRIPRTRRRYSPIKSGGVTLPSGSIARIAAKAGVSATFAFRVAKGLKKSARVKREIEALAERIRRAG